MLYCFKILFSLLAVIETVAQTVDEIGMTKMTAMSVIKDVIEQIIVIIKSVAKEVVIDAIVPNQDPDHVIDQMLQFDLINTIEMQLKSHRKV